MSPDLRPIARAARFATPAVGAIPFVLALAVLLVVLFVGPARTDNAQETTGRETSETTMSMPEGIEVGDGEISINGGDVSVGNGCAKAGDVVAGDCDEERGEDDRETTFSGLASPESSSQENSSQENTVLTEETTVLETTGFETSSPKATSELTAPEGTTSREGEGLCPAKPSGEAMEATVERAVDGDTLELAEELGGTDRVRLMGVDTPEPEGENGDPEPYAEEAAAFTAETLEGEKVLLEIGEEGTDDYGRLLAYVWTSEVTEQGFVGGLKRMVGMNGSEIFNRTLLAEGYAEVLTIEPNDPYTGCFEAAERASRDDGAGIWSTDDGSSDEQYGGEEAEPRQTVPEMTAEQTLPEETGGPEVTPEEDTTANQPSPPPGTAISEDSVPETLVPDVPSVEENSGGENTSLEEDDTPTDRASRESPAQGQYTDTDDEHVPVPEPPAEEPIDEAVPVPKDEGQDDLDLIPAIPAPVGSAPPASAPPLESETPSSSTASPVPEEVGLPTRDTPEGSVAVLPETGGPSPFLIAGAFLICCGVGLLTASRRRAAGRRRG